MNSTLSMQFRPKKAMKQKDKRDKKSQNKKIRFKARKEAQVKIFDMINSC